MQRAEPIILAGYLTSGTAPEVLAVHPQHAWARCGFGKRLCRSGQWWPRGVLSPTPSCVLASAKGCEYLGRAGFGVLHKKIKALCQEASGVCVLSLISSSPKNL